MTYEYKTLSLKELYEAYLSLDINKDLLAEPPRISFFKTSIDPNEIMFVYLDGNKVIAIGSLESYDNYTYFKKYISVDSKYQNQGLGKKILEKFYEYANEHQLAFINGKYSQQGQKYLQENSIYLAKKYNIICYENTNEYENLFDC